ncbi:MAG: hypothetical protein K2I14_00260 [Eubacterium sp.]|nr:hypothetical protein [Eubacterium sp.]
MTPEIYNGDYVKNGKALKEIEHIDELLQNAALNIRAERGRFYPDKNFGSHIFLSDNMDEKYIAGLASRALSCINGVYIKSVKVNDETIEFTVIVNNLERQVLIKREFNL